jgi:heat-inducible transcriptional repressor
MSDDVMLDERKASILRAVVEEYIETAQPVGSGHVANAAGVNVSSATIRNEMAALEQDGYLRQPHTSAGRIPTEKGYRYFVDHVVASLPGPGRLERSQAEQVKAFFARAHGHLEHLLHDTSRMLSDVTRYTAVVTAAPTERATVRSVQLVGLAPRVALLVVVLNTGEVEKRTLELSQDVGDERLAAASTRLGVLLVGTSFGRFDPPTATGDEATDAVVRSALEALASDPDPDEQVFVGGAARVAAGFDTVERVREVLDLLEHQYVVVTLLRSVIDRGLHVAIGSETGLESLAECSVIVAPYTVKGEPTGTVGVLGPTRMNYPQAMAAVAVVSRRLGHHLAES